MYFVLLITRVIMIYYYYYYYVLFYYVSGFLMASPLQQHTKRRLLHWSFKLIIITTLDSTVMHCAAINKHKVNCCYAAHLPVIVCKYDSR